MAAGGTCARCCLTCLRASTSSGRARKRVSMRVARCRQPSEAAAVQCRGAEGQRSATSAVLQFLAADAARAVWLSTFQHVVVDEGAGELLRVVQQLNLQYAILDQQIATRLAWMYAAVSVAQSNRSVPRRAPALLSRLSGWPLTVLGVDERHALEAIDGMASEVSICHSNAKAHASQMRWRLS